MINKKNVLGKNPEEIGIKDAIHTAIVSVRAAGPIKPGQRCGINEYGEAVPNDNGPGAADPFHSGTILCGQSFWLLLGQHEVPNVRHEWEHDSIAFLAPTRPIKINSTLEVYAKDLGVSYEQLMAAAAHVVENDSAAPYPGTKTSDEVKLAQNDLSDLWSEWGEESCHKFYNSGTECCPKYQYPEMLFDLETVTDNGIVAQVDKVV
jgi:hypothetical protein